MEIEVTAPNGRTIITNQSDYDKLAKQLKVDGFCRHSLYTSPKTGIMKEGWITTYQMKKITGECGC